MGVRAAALGRGARIISLIGAAHFMSHVYQLSLPPLFPLLKAEMGVSYTALGLLLTMFSLASALGQVPVGFLVDRVGGRSILLLGLCVQAAAIGLIGVSGSYWALLALYTAAGLAHSVYHPADYAILSRTVERGRLGRAFSIHSFTGTTGSAATPLVMVALTALVDWRAAFAAIGLVGIAVAGVLWSQGAVLAGDAAAGGAKRGEPAPSGAFGQGLRLLFSAPMLAFFLFYVLLTIGFSGVRAFSVAALVDMDAAPLAGANGALTGYMIGISAGILAGGVIADRIGPRNLTAVVGLVSAAGLFALVAGVSLPAAAIVAALAAAGFLRGAVQATRDLLIFALTPDGSHGKVFAFVSSGAHVGQALMPLMFGWIMDRAEPAWVFWLAAAMALIALLTFLGVNRPARR